MKKFLATFLTIAMMAILVPLTANAQTKRKKYYRERTQTTRQYRERRQYRRQNQNIYQRHRNAINIGIGGAAGAIVGGIIGGKRGALIGAGVGAGSGAAYTYGINPKNKRKQRRYYRHP